MEYIYVGVVCLIVGFVVGFFVGKKHGIRVEQAANTIRESAKGIAGKL